MTLSDSSDPARLRRVKTEILVGWIIALLVLITWIANFLWYTIGLGGIFMGVVFLVLMIPSVLVLRHASQMRSAANLGNLSRLEQLNSVGWGVVALIFSGVVPGIMLLMANGPIHELGPGSTGGASGSGQHPGSESEYKPRPSDTLVEGS
jgi:hypothetical protein